MAAVLVTGAEGGIGRALCSAFRSAGHFVVGTDLKGGDASWDAFVAGDLERLVKDPGCLRDFLVDIRDAIDGRELVAIVNNAAVQILGSSEEVRTEDWFQTLSVNLVAPFLLVQGLLAELQRAQGAVINVGSIHANLTKPGFVCYATSKAALAGLTRSMAVDLGGTVRINGIQPGATATPMLLRGFEANPSSLERLGSMHPSGRIAEPEEIAKAAVFLASRDATFVNGAILDVNGAIGARLHDPE